jgi:quinol monooxygenase YgiN
MLILHVAIHVKPECVEAFIAATKENARNSRLEPQVLRFDVAQQADDPTKFMLYEVYRTPEGHASHRTTAHFATWRDTVNDMMVVPRVGTRYTNLSPIDAEW